MTPFIASCAAAAGYLAGSVSFARLVGRLVAPQMDMTQTELGIPGHEQKFMYQAASATVVSLRLGPKAGCLTSLLDMLKVALPTLAFKLGYPETSYFLITAALGVVGHNWPLYHRFKGGRGMSPIFGGMFVIDWIGILATSLGGSFIGLVLFRDAFLTYTTGVVLLIPWLWFRTHDPAHLAYALVINAAFWTASIPEIRQHLRFKREEEIDIAAALQSVSMGRGMLRIAHLMGVIKEDVGHTDPEPDQYTER
jgi:glycerol-3-phosphate acyltransferase PlsY